MDTAANRCCSFTVYTAIELVWLFSIYQQLDKTQLEIKRLQTILKNKSGPLVLLLKNINNIKDHQGPDYSEPLQSIHKYLNVRLNNYRLLVGSYYTKATSCPKMPTPISLF